MRVIKQLVGGCCDGRESPALLDELGFVCEHDTEYLKPAKWFDWVKIRLDGVMIGDIVGVIPMTASSLSEDIVASPEEADYRIGQP